MKVLIASVKSEANELRAALERAGHEVDAILPRKLNGTEQKDYNFVVVDAVIDERVLRNGNVELVLETRTLRRNKKLVKVTPLELRIIGYFMEHRNEVVTRADLAAGCWDVSDGVSDNTIEVYVGRIRNKLGTSVIRTIHGVGYQMDKK